VIYLTLSDEFAVKQVIGGLMRNTLLLTEYPDINAVEDFTTKIAKICFVAINTLYQEGATKLTVYEVDQTINRNEYSAAALEYKKGGQAWLVNAFETAEVNNFEIYFMRVKKYSLLRRLQHDGYDISEYYIDDKSILQTPALAQKEREIQEKFDASSLEDILLSVESKFNKIRNDYLNGGKINGDPSAGIYELIEELRTAPNVGMPLNGEIFNSACRGAREGCFFLKSASTSAGKTRTSVFDACKIAFPTSYSLTANTFVTECEDDGQVREPQKVLFIVTEMDKSELQTIMLAYLSKVNEEHILTGTYLVTEYERVQYAASIIEKYHDYFIIEEISDPNLTNVEATIKKYATMDNVKYVFYDYIHSTPGLLAQFAKNGINEASILMLLSNQLKQLAKDYNLFIYSATQVNQFAMGDDGEFKNEMSIRGSKAVADKVDCGYVMTKVSTKMWQSLIPQLKSAASKGLISSSVFMSDYERPTHVLDIYKMRRGRWKNVRIWIYLDLGTGDRQDLFMTTAENEPITQPLTSYQIYNEVEELDWGKKC